MEKCWILHKNSLEETRGEINSKNHAWVTLENGHNIFRHNVSFSERKGLKKVLHGIRFEIEFLKRRKCEIRKRLKILK